MLPIPCAESKAAVQVYAEQSEGVVAAAAQLLPCAVLAPEATIRRLLTDGVQHSGQVRIPQMMHVLPRKYLRPQLCIQLHAERCPRWFVRWNVERFHCLAGGIYR